MTATESLLTDPGRAGHGSRVELACRSIDGTGLDVRPHVLMDEGADWMAYCVATMTRQRVAKGAGLRICMEYASRLKEGKG